MKKPNGYWTKERCHEEALKYPRRCDFSVGCGSAYITANKNGWLDEICGHMVSIVKAHGYWNNRDRCSKEALKYGSRSDFINGSVGAYGAARRNNWIDEICAHMTSSQKPHGYWTKERCREAALKCGTKKEFRELQNPALVAAQAKGWLDDICGHMAILQQPKGYWTKERCAEMASRYKSRSLFQKNERACYHASLKNGWHDEVCAHMPPLASLRTRKIYAIEFADNSVYVGLSYNPQIRYKAHINSSSNKHVKTKVNSHIPHKFMVFDGEYLMCDAGIHEEKKIAEYDLLGFSLLNLCKSGGLGGRAIKWTYEALIKEALKYNSRNEFAKAKRGAYGAAQSLGILDEVCAHMGEKRTTRKAA